MKRSSGLLAVAIALSACTEAPLGVDAALEAVTIATADEACMSAAEMVMAQKLNHVRASAGLPALEIDTRLVAAAWRHNVDMAARGFLGHKGSDGSSFVVRAGEAGYVQPSAQFIVRARPTMTPEQGAQIFTDDLTHLVALQQPLHRHIGVSREPGQDGLVYWTIVFGSDSGAALMNGCAALQ